MQRQLSMLAIIIGIMGTAGCDGETATDPDPGIGGTAGAGGSSGGTGGTAGPSPTRPLSELTPMESAQYCEQQRTFAAETGACRLEGITAASSAGGTREESVAACEAAIADCEAEIETKPCKTYSADCAATVADTVVCMDDLAEFFGALPECVDFEEGRPSFPASCQMLQSICPEFF